MRTKLQSPNPRAKEKSTSFRSVTDDTKQTADESKAQPQTACEIEQLHSADVNGDITPSIQPSGAEIDQNVDTVKNVDAHHISDEAVSRSVHVEMK